MNRRTQAWLIIGGSVSFLVFLLCAKLIISPVPVCDPSVKTKTVILLDHSEDVSHQTIDVIVERAWKYIEETVKEGELVSVFNLTKASKKDLRPIFFGCKPRKDGSRSFEDIKRIKRDFEEKFKKPIRSLLSAPITGSDESPIAQAIIDLSLDDAHFRSIDVTRLLVFSDFLENTPKYSMYKCVDPSQTVNAFRASRVGAVERPVFRKVDVQMNIIPRDKIGRVVLECRDKFWIWFFGDNKGSLTPDYLPG